MCLRNRKEKEENGDKGRGGKGKEGRISIMHVQWLDCLFLDNADLTGSRG